MVLNNFFQKLLYHYMCTGPPDGTRGSFGALAYKSE